MFPAQPTPAAAPTQARPGSGKKLAIGALVVVGGIVAIAVLAGGGNGASGTKADGTAGMSPRIARDMAAWSKFRDEICACHDRGCAKRIHDEEDRYVSAHEGEPDEPAPPEFKAVLLEAGRCFQAAAAKQSEEDEGIDDDVMTQELGNLRDKMCECRNKACANDVAEGLQDWAKQYKPRFDSRPADVRKQALSILEATNKCYDKASGK